MLSQFFCPSSKIAQPRYAKGASERARSASVYGKGFNLFTIVFLLKMIKEMFQLFEELTALYHREEVRLLK